MTTSDIEKSAEGVLRIGGMLATAIFNLSQIPGLKDDLATAAALVPAWGAAAARLRSDVQALSTAEEPNL
jgi:hypothetical protein